MSTPESDFLGQTFRCERFLGLFPTGMPMRACLRRHLERQPAKDGRGRALPLAQWPAARPFCASECQLGRQHLEEARAAGVPAETCLRCGAAQVGSGSAAPCQGCGPDEKQVPRGYLPPGGPDKSSRIWNGEAPDVPIGAPSAGQVATLPAMRRLADQQRESFEQREREAAERRARAQEQDHQEEDQVMAKDEEKHCKKCGKKLRSDNTRGVCGHSCKPVGGVQAATPKAEKAKSPSRRVVVEATVQMPGITTPELLKQRAAIDEELRRRLAVAQDEIVALKAAVGAG